MTPLHYREAAMEKPKEDQIDEFVAFGAACPFCGSKMMQCSTQYGGGGFFVDAGDVGRYRILVRRRSWSFLWWRSHPAYYKIKCDQCKEFHKELLPVPNKET